MLDGEETVQIACGELRWKGTRQLDGWETVEIVSESFAGRKRDSMLDGEETVQIACGELRWEGNRENSLRRAPLGGSETACWTERKPWK